MNRGILLSAITAIWFFATAAATTIACGVSPAASPSDPPTGTLIVTIVTGPQRVPFHPKLARIQQANAQLTKILGHSIQIELDGSLLGQDQDGAEEVIAYLVENLARDLDALKTEDAAALAFAHDHFERLSVRYAPAEAAAREKHDGWSRRSHAGKLDLSTKTIDVVRSEAHWIALERDEVTSVIYEAFSAGQDSRYARVLPDAIPKGERKGWFDYHVHGAHNPSAAKEPPYTIVGSLNTIVVRGMVILNGLSVRDGDAALTKDSRAWLIDRAMSDFSGIYHHNANDVESAPPSSPYKQAESAYTNWLRTELPHMTVEERGKVAEYLWVTDFRKDNGERDRYATYAFPGIDPMAFSFDAVDAWIAAGHPMESRSGLFDIVVCPTNMETREGQIHFDSPGRSEGTFYRWALANKTREDALVKGMIARPDVLFAQAAFYNARRSLHEEGDYIRFLRRFETTPVMWRVGADVHREVVYRPSQGLLEESRRFWREVPIAKPYALLWFARHTENSYSDWPDLIQDKPADEAILSGYLDLGWDAFSNLPAAWPGLAKNNGRMRIIETRAQKFLASGADRPRNGGPNVTGILSSIAHILCEDRSMGELAELRSFAQSELPKWPGLGLSDVVEAADPATCKPSHRASVVATPKKKKSQRAPGSEGKGDLF